MTDSLLKKKAIYIGGYPPGLISSELDEYMADLPLADSWNYFKQSIASRRVTMNSDLKIKPAKYDTNDWVNVIDHQPHLVVLTGRHHHWFIAPSIPLLATTLDEHPDPFELGGTNSSFLPQIMRFYIEPEQRTVGKIEGNEAFGGPRDHREALENFKGIAIIVPVMQFREGAARPDRLLFQANYRKGGDKIWVTQRQMTDFRPV